MELRRGGTPVKLREQSLNILVFLLEHAGEIVTREELRRLLWPSDTFVDFDHSLNTAVMKLREALGDSVEAPLYIETIPKRGYRFIAPVSPPTDLPSGVGNSDGESASLPVDDKRRALLPSQPRVRSPIAGLGGPTLSSRWRCSSQVDSPRFFWYVILHPRATKIRFHPSCKLCLSLPRRATRYFLPSRPTSAKSPLPGTAQIEGDTTYMCSWWVQICRFASPTARAV